MAEMSDDEIERVLLESLDPEHEAFADDELPTVAEVWERLQGEGKVDVQIAFSSMNNGPLTEHEKPQLTETGLVRLNELKQKLG